MADPKPILTLLFDGRPDEEVAAYIVAELGTGRAISVFWSMAQALPVVCTESCDKEEIMIAFADEMYTGFDGDNDTKIELNCTDGELTAVMHQVAQSNWERTHETIRDAICETLIEKGMTRPVTSTSSINSSNSVTPRGNE